MNPVHQGMKRIASSISSPKHICLSCRRTLASSQRNYATSAATAPSPSPPTIHPTPPITSTQPHPQPTYTIKAGILLSRPPILTPSPHPFETAYHLYQRRLNERLVLPFTQYFYFKPDTPAFETWRVARKSRNGVAARDVGGYDAHGKEGWNDEVLVGDRTGEKEVLVRQLIEEEGRGADFVGEEGGEKEKEMGGLRRMTEADRSGDVRSLERKLARTLYLVVKRRRVAGKEGWYWGFPSGTLEVKEGLKEAAERILYSSCGPNMNTWFVGSHPVGHYTYKIRNPARTTQSDSLTTIQPQTRLAGEKTFFMKSRISRGQADPKGNGMGVEDFKWLSKEEIQNEVSPAYWASVKNMLVEQ